MLSRNVERFRGGLVVKAHRLLCHSTLGVAVIKKKKKVRAEGCVQNVVRHGSASLIRRV